MSDSSPDQHAHRSLHVADAPFDAASQSLADSLRASFSVLKVIMIVLAVWFLFSEFKCVQENQRAVVFRFGKLQPEPRYSGLSPAFPYPIDQTLQVGVAAETLTFDTHWFHVLPDEQGVSLGRISRGGQGLSPVHDGYLLTADKGVAHVKWVLVYSITDLVDFVRNVTDSADDGQRREATTALLETLLQNAALRVAAGFTAEEITQSRTGEFARSVKNILNGELEALGTGIELTTVEIPIATVPLQVRPAFLAVTAAESGKNSEIEQAQQRSNDLLNKTAGPAYHKLVGTNQAPIGELLATWEQAKAEGDPAKTRTIEEAIGLLNLLDVVRGRGDADEVARLERDMDDILTNEAAGSVGTWLRNAEANYTRVVHELEGDVEEYQALVPEFEQSPRLLIDRLWQQTRRKVLSYTGVTKYWLPAGKKEMRIHIGPDPEARRQQEIETYKKERESGFKGPPPQYRILGPDEE